MAERTFQNMLKDTLEVKNNLKSVLSLTRNMDGVKFSQYPNIVRSLATKHWGFKVSKSDSNPATSVTYLYDAVGVTPAGMSYSNNEGEWSWGGWKPFFDSFFRPVMLKYDGSVDYELDHGDQTKKIDGVTASDIGNANYGGNAMVEVRRIWTKITEDSNYYYVEFSNVQPDDGFSADAFIDSTGVLKDCAYYSMYEGSYQNSKLRSLASGSVMASQTGSTEISRAEANGTGWYITPYSLHNLIALLHVLLAKNLNCQGAFGNGNSNNSAYIAPGALKAYGPFKGYSDETHAVKSFYIENFWANYWMRCAGLLLVNRGTDASPDYQQAYKGRPPYNNTGDGYANCGRGPASNNYVKTMKPVSNVLVPLTVGGSATTYFCDYYYQANPTAAEPKFALVGGSRGNAAYCGPFYVNLDNALSNSNSNIGARLASLIVKQIRKKHKKFYGERDPHPLVKISHYRPGLVGSISKSLETIRNMKRIGNVYEKIKSEENIRQAIYTAAKNKLHRNAVKTVLSDVEKHVRIIRDMLENHTYEPCEVRERDVLEGSKRKKRHITTIAFFPDQVIHWCVIRQISPYLMKRSYQLSCGSMPSRGSQYAKKFINRWLRHDPVKTKYCAKLDVSRFYPSIPHSVIAKELERKFKDKELLDLLEKITGHWNATRSFDGDWIGIPIGFLTSQWLANLILSPIDYAIKQRAGIPYYIRYMDDMVLFAANPYFLHKAVRTVRAELWNRGLRLKSNWQVFKTGSRPVDVLGFRFYPGKTTLRKALMLRISRKASAIRHKYAPTARQAKSIMSYMGWIRHSDSHNFFKSRIEKYVDIKRAKLIISKYDKERNHETISVRIGRETRTA